MKPGPPSNPAPYVPASARLPEFTIRAVVLGILQACILGAANAYLGMKAGQTIAATFPAAVVSMLVLRFFRNRSILEENLARTSASVGEALVAGAIFTLPAFVISGLWKEFHYWESTLLMLVGGTLGVLFVIFLRRPLCEDPALPFPEAVAAAEIHKAGQKGARGGGYLFGAMGLAGLIELLKNSAGLAAIVDTVERFVPFRASSITFLQRGQPFGQPGSFGGGVLLQSPFASPSFMGVGYIIGPKLAALNFSGGVLAWIIFVPLILFLSGEGGPLMNLSAEPSLAEATHLERMTFVADQAWRSLVRPIAVGAMLVSACWTLFRMRGSLTAGVARLMSDLRKGRDPVAESSRLEKDIPLKWAAAGTLVLLAPMAALFGWYTHGFGGAVVAAVVMTAAGFVFSAVAGYLVGTIGSSASPVSGLALSSLLIAALLLVAIGVKGDAGVMAVLAVAAVVCCAVSIGGDIIQDLKVGFILGGTPWAMQAAEILAVLCTAFVLVFPIAWLHSADIAQGGSGLGGDALPAPQAGLMAMLAQGVVGGDMAWPLVLIGVGLAIGLIMLGCPSPMIVAVGMYLNFATSSAIFVGGVLRWVADRLMARRGMGPAEAEHRVNIGTLLASGMIAGEALVAILLAILVNQGIRLTLFEEGSGWGGLLVFAAVAGVLLLIPLRAPRPRSG
ncbi:MAG TPA: oligopeptide transporter, OPT family [Candidatus Polarisedimenticolia bacterium]|nr:oligopeptide transporter, OPT family [Candidatus Polarisedimenticolia bacterium]